MQSRQTHVYTSASTCPVSNAVLHSGHDSMRQSHCNQQRFSPSPQHPSTSGHLHSQLPCGREDERIGGSDLAGSEQQALQYREREGRRLA